MLQSRFYWIFRLFQLAVYLDFCPALSLYTIGRAGLVHSCCLWWLACEWILPGLHISRCTDLQNSQSTGFFLPLVHSSHLVRRLRYTSGLLFLYIRRLALHILSGTDSGMPFMRISGFAGSAGGCFFFSWLITSGVGSRDVPSISFPASPTLPDVTAFVKFRNNVLSDVLNFPFDSRFCNSLDSFMSSLTFPCTRVRTFAAVHSHCPWFCCF